MKTNKNLRPHRVGFRLSDAEYEKLKSDFKEFGYQKISEFARFKLLLEISYGENILISTDLKTELKQFNYQVNKLGHNINQIAKALHTHSISHQLAIEKVNNYMSFLYKIAHSLDEMVDKKL